jgi:hypothetical protein
MCLKNKATSKIHGLLETGVRDTEADVNILQVLVLKTSKNRPKN